MVVGGQDSLIGSLLPAGVVTAESFDDPPGLVLYPGEEESVRNAVDKRRREYTTVRHCARQALAVLGLPPAPILSGPKREPLWPEGIIGSMTHCDGYRAAAVARAGGLASIGIDAEPHGPLPEGVLGTIARPEELIRVAELEAAHPDVQWGRLLFSAKESVYKTWFPLARCWLGFEEATVDFELDAFVPSSVDTAGSDSDPAGSDAADFDTDVKVGGGMFTAALHRTGLEVAGRPIDQLTGRWLVRKGLVITAVSLAAAG